MSSSRASVSGWCCLHGGDEDRPGVGDQDVDLPGLPDRRGDAVRVGDVEREPLVAGRPASVLGSGAVAITRWPRRANSAAAARPMPLDAPVISTDAMKAS